MHSGIPFGLAAIKFRMRKKFRGTNTLKKKIHPARVAIEQKESHRWIEGLRNATKSGVMGLRPALRWPRR
jgi:hypothetical protein